MRAVSTNWKSTVITSVAETVDQANLVNRFPA